MTTATLEDELRTRAFELGFGQVSITPATLPPQVGARLDQSVADGFHGSMDWLAETAQRRRSPDAMWTGARSAITLAILSPQDRDRLMGGLATLRRAGTKIAFDSNYRPALWPDAATARAQIERAWRLTDIGLPSLDDEQALYGDGDEAAVIARLNAWGVTDGALKCGAAGPRPLDGGDAPPCEAAPKVIDSTAAGDSFNGGYLAARLKGESGLTALERGHALARLVVQHRGAIVPRHLMGELP